MADDVGTAMPIFFGMGGASMAIVLSNIGAALGISYAGKGLAAMGVMYPEAVMKNIVPVVMAGVTGIYGLIVAVLITLAINKPEAQEGAATLINTYGWNDGFKHFAAGITIGASGIGGGWAIGVVGDHGQKAVGLRPQLFVPMILIVSFAGAVPLYGLIAAMIMTTS